MDEFSFILCSNDNKYLTYASIIFTSSSTSAIDKSTYESHSQKSFWNYHHSFNFHMVSSHFYFFHSIFFSFLFSFILRNVWNCKHKIRFVIIFSTKKIYSNSDHRVDIFFCFTSKNIYVRTLHIFMWDFCVCS